MWSKNYQIKKEVDPWLIPYPKCLTGIKKTICQQFKYHELMTLQISWQGLDNDLGLDLT